MDQLVKEKAKYTVEKSIYDVKQVFLGFTKISKILFYVFLIGFIPAYFIAKYSTSAAYDLKYAGQLVTAKESTVLASPLEQTPVKVFSLGGNAYSAMAGVSNTNLDVAVSTTDYEFEFKDSAGVTLTRSKGTFYLLPNTQTSLIVPRIESEFPIVSGILKIGTPRFQKRISISQVDLQASTPSSYFQLEPVAYVLEGSVYNNSPYTLKQVTLKFLLFDEKDNLVGVSSREEFSVGSFERRSYKQVWSGSTTESTQNVVRVAVFPDTNVLDFQNLRQ